MSVNQKQGQERNEAPDFFAHLGCQHFYSFKWYKIVSRIIADDPKVKVSITFTPISRFDTTTKAKAELVPISLLILTRRKKKTKSDFYCLVYFTTTG